MLDRRVPDHCRPWYAVGVYTGSSMAAFFAAVVAGEWVLLSMTAFCGGLALLVWRMAPAEPTPHSAGPQEGSVTGP